MSILSDWVGAPELESLPAAVSRLDQTQLAIMFGLFPSRS